MMNWLYDKFREYRSACAYAASVGVLAIATIGALSGKNEPIKPSIPLEQRVVKERKNKPDFPAPFVVNGTPASNLAIIVGDSADTTDVVVGMGEVIQNMQREAIRKQVLIDVLDIKYASGDYTPLNDEIYNARIKHEGKEYLVYGEKQKVWIVAEGTLENNRHVYMRQLPVGRAKLASELDK